MCMIVRTQDRYYRSLLQKRPIKAQVRDTVETHSVYVYTCIRIYTYTHTIDLNFHMHIHTYASYYASTGS